MYKTEQEPRTVFCFLPRTAFQSWGRFISFGSRRGSKKTTCWLRVKPTLQTSKGAFGSMHWALHTQQWLGAWPLGSLSLGSSLACVTMGKLLNLFGPHFFFFTYKIGIIKFLQKPHRVVAGFSKQKDTMLNYCMEHTYTKNYLLFIWNSDLTGNSGFSWNITL